MDELWARGENVVKGPCTISLIGLVGHCLDFHEQFFQGPQLIKLVLSLYEQFLLLHDKFCTPAFALSGQEPQRVTLGPGRALGEPLAVNSGLHSFPFFAINLQDWYPEHPSVFVSSGQTSLQVNLSPLCLWDCQVPCHQDLQCERKCQRMRDCGRHACKRRCCDGDCPLCSEVCNWFLNLTSTFPSYLVTL